MIYYVLIFMFVNFIYIIALFVLKKPVLRIKTLKRIIYRKYPKEFKGLIAGFKEELSYMYFNHIKETTQRDPQKIITSRPLIREWLYNELKLLKEKTPRINTFSLMARIYKCYSLLGKRGKALCFLERLQLNNPKDDEVKLLIEYEKEMLKFDKNMDEWVVLANPEKYPEKRLTLTEFKNKFIAPIIKNHDPWALTDKHFSDAPKLKI
ncbi:MAG: hypothetical protein A2X49_12000 [Lentisphaerae bacterium GWF2_52_8]|nr:MAG: hypothetical protein A2X49_12000 [Lentisphaerae bacterium GWF2_52_8]